MLLPHNSMSALMPKTFDILKKRWMEVVFLVCFTSSPSIVSRAFIILRSGRTNTGPLIALNWAIAIFGWAVYIFYIFFYAGFLRSVCIQREQTQRLGTLFKIGIPFFGQILIFQLISSLINMGLLIYPSNYLVNLLGTETYFSYSWVFNLVSLAITIALLKLRLFIPSLIIVRRLNIITAFKALKQYKLFAAKEMLVIFALSYVVSWGGYRIIKLTVVIRPVFLISETALHLILNVFSLAIMLSAVKFIYDNTETTSEATGEQIE